LLYSKSKADVKRVDPADVELQGQSNIMRFIRPEVLPSEWDDGVGWAVPRDEATGRHEDDE